MEEEYKFNIEKVSPIWLITALCVVPFGLYQLLNFLSPLIHRLTAMKISAVCVNGGEHNERKRDANSKDYQMYIYPIKSLRAVKVTEAIATAHGFKHDRRTDQHPFDNNSKPC